MALLDEAKKAVRISAAQTAFDDEIQGLIDAARADLKLSGVWATKVEDDTDPLIKRAVFVYVKANFGLDNPDAIRFQASYDSIKAHLTLSIEYTEEQTS